MQKRIMQFAVMAVVCAVAGGVAFAAGTGTIANDDQSGGPALISDTVVFVGDTDWTGHVDYAVYAPTKYPGTHSDKNTSYIYAYQIFNDSTSNATLSYLSVGLASDAGAANPVGDSTYGVSGGGAPALSQLVGTLPTSVQWIGSGSALSAWAPGTHSTVLLFSSPYIYTFDPATMANGGEGDTQSLPGPLPEPGALILLCSGAMPVLLKYHRRRRAEV